MKILADTHLILWSLTDDEKLSKAARKVMSDSQNKLYCSVGDSAKTVRRSSA